MKFLQDVAKDTGETPKALKDRPTLRDDLAHLMESFFELSAQRLVGETAQPLQISEVLAYVELLGIDSPIERERLFTMVRKLDAVFLEHVRATLNKK